MFDHGFLSVGSLGFFCPARVGALDRSRFRKRGGRLFGQFFVGRLTLENRDQPRESGALYYFRASG
jgi:hypothetical protein